MRGVVLEFDFHRGFGTVRGEDGRELFFHCTRIADGTRDIPVGSEVSFSVVPGHHGKWEAADVRAVGPGDASTVNGAG
jgi:CspA family cold shock protein